MRKFIFVLSFLLFQNLVTAQEAEAPENKYKPGIYKTYSEFLTGTPSIPLNFEFKQKKHGYGLFGMGGNIPVTYLKVKKKEGKAIGTVFGFSDGKNIYINPWEEELSGRVKFYQPEFIGHYCYMEYIYTLSVNGRGSHSKKEMIIDMKNHKTFELDKWTLKDLLSSNKELSESFKEERNKNAVLKDYFVKYVEQENVAR